MKKRHYEMFSPEGEQACEKLVQDISVVINGDLRVTHEQIASLLKNGVEKIADKHEEVNDTEPEWHIVDYINEDLSNAGYSIKMTRSDLY